MIDNNKAKSIKTRKRLEENLLAKYKKGKELFIVSHLINLINKP